MPESVWDYPRPPRWERCDERVTVTFSGESLADTTRAIRVLETSHPPAFYLPPEDVNAAMLRPAGGRSLCEWKGVASYLDVVARPGAADEAVAERAAWVYRDPVPAFAELKDHLAVYPVADGRVHGGRGGRHGSGGRFLRRLDHFRRRRPLQGSAGDAGVVSAAGGVKAAGGCEGPAATRTLFAPVPRRRRSRPPPLLTGPIFTREARTAPRSARHFVLRAGYVLALFVLLYTAEKALVGLTGDLSAAGRARFGALAFQLLAAVQLTLCLFFALLFAAGNVAQEKDRRTLILLLMTDLRSRELVLGKLSASLLGVAALIACGAPVFFLVRLAGGVSVAQIGWAVRAVRGGVAGGRGVGRAVRVLAGKNLPEPRAGRAGVGRLAGRDRSRGPAGRGGLGPRPRRRRAETRSGRWPA